MNDDRLTILVSIDGLAVRHISPIHTPTLIELARSGASCFAAQTVQPPITLPAHVSMMRGVDPEAHGILGNIPKTPETKAPSILAQARRAGLKTACFANWLPFECIFEEDALDEKYFINGGYDVGEDKITLVAAKQSLLRRDNDVVFVYFAQADLVGHESGWDSEAYLTAISDVDHLLRQLVASTKPTDTIIVTTDHGGYGSCHQEVRPENMQTFIAARSVDISPNSFWREASILDIPPMVADLAGFSPHKLWQKESIVGFEEPLEDFLIFLLQSMSEHRYGEQLNMLEHSLQAAALAVANHADDSMVLACLLHDLGHLIQLSGDRAGAFGLASHADVGALFLQHIFNPSIYQPIRLHVQAKRYLISTDDSYLGKLSHASLETLKQQGSELSEHEIEKFEQEAFFEQAIQLRKFDDSGKVENLDVQPLESYRALLCSALEAKMIDPAWARDACSCADCRDSKSGQHLIDADELLGWQVVGESRTAEELKIRLRNNDGRTHLCLIGTQEHETENRLLTKLWKDDFGTTLKAQAVDSNENIESVYAQMLENGIALVTGLKPQEGEVLNFAKRIAYVRETNYGESFDVLAEPDPINLAYTPIGLPLHTDNPYRDPCPGVQLLHCIQNAKRGGASLFADGFKAAERLRREFPKYFNVLSEQVLSFRFKSDGVNLSTRKPIIELTVQGQIATIRVNNRSMQAPELNGPSNALFYSAYGKFCEFLKESSIEHVLEPGQLVMFDNSRILHGRRGYKISERRHLQGCYVDIDAIRSNAMVAQN